MENNIETIEFPSENKIFKEVSVSISLSKTLCLEVPENATSEQIQEQAKQEIMTPDVIMKIAEQVFQQYRIGVQGIDFKGWNVDELEYIVE